MEYNLERICMKFTRWLICISIHILFVCFIANINIFWLHVVTYRSDAFYFLKCGKRISDFWTLVFVRDISEAWGQMGSYNNSKSPLGPVGYMKLQIGCKAWSSWQFYVMSIWASCECESFSWSQTLSHKQKKKQTFLPDTVIFQTSIIYIGRCFQSKLCSCENELSIFYFYCTCRSTNLPPYHMLQYTVALTDREEQNFTLCK